MTAILLTAPLQGWANALDEVPDGYRAMNDREALKVLIEL